MSDLPEIALVFLRLGLLSFGGGLAILPEMERLVVSEYGWVTHREFVDSYALGRLTPGPGMLMVMFTGYRAAGLPGAVVALAALFAPTALITALAATYWDRLRASPWLLAFQRASAPVALGLIAAAGYTLLQSAVQDGFGAILAAACLFVLLKWHPNPSLVVLGAGLVAAVFYGVAG